MFILSKSLIFLDSVMSLWQKQERLWVKFPVRANRSIPVTLDLRGHLD